MPGLLKRAKYGAGKARLGSPVARKAGNPFPVKRMALYFVHFSYYLHYPSER